MPNMVGGQIGCYNGHEYLKYDVKFYMIGTYVGEYALTYKPINHGRPGVGATKGSSHIEKRWFNMFYFSLFELNKYFYL